MRGGIRDRQLRELRELLAAEQHDEGVLADQHAAGVLVAELRVEAEPELREERPAALDVRYGEVHEQRAAGMCGSGHGDLQSGDSMAYVLLDPPRRRNSSVLSATLPVRSAVHEGVHRSTVL